MNLCLLQLFFFVLLLFKYNFAGPISVSCGGTGFTKMPAHGILCSHPDLDKLHIVESQCEGLILCSAPQGCNPVFIQPTAGPGLSITANETVFEYGLQVPIQVDSGGTGHTGIPAHSVLVGQDDAALGIVTPSMTSGVALISQGPFADPVFGTVSVVGGGTGQTSFPRNGVLIGQLNSALVATAPGTDGQVFLGATNKAPSFIKPTAGTGLAIKSDAKTLQYSLKIPVGVEHGGTGKAAIAAYSLIAGGETDTSCVQTLSCGNPGEVLCSNGPNALPSWRALPESSCSQSSNSEINSVTLTAFDALEVVYPNTMMQLQFTYGINPEIINVATIGTGTVGSGSNCAQLQTGIGVNASAMLQSKARVHYQNGHGCKIAISCVFSSGIAGTVQMAGLGTARDGFFFGYDGASFGILHRNNFVDHWIEQTAWNVDTFDGHGASHIALDPTKGNMYQIQFQCLDFGVINFLIQNPNTGMMTLVHKIRYGNAHTAPAISNVSLPLMAHVSNSSNKANIALNLFSMTAFSGGVTHNQLDVRNSVGGTKKINVDTINIITLRNNMTFQNQPNQVMIYPDCLSVSNASASVAIFTLYLNPTVTGTPTFVNIDVQNSVASYDIAGMAVCGGRRLISFFVNNGSYLTINLRDYGIFLSPGDCLVVAAATSTGNSNVYASVSWLERF